jgi:hypothetical protein
MFFVLMFLGVASFSVYAFPEWDWPTVLLVSIAFVVAVRLLFFLHKRTTR